MIFWRLTCFVGNFDPIETKIISRLYTISLKILVTGGAGFIGRYLVDFLIKGNEVTIYDNLSNSSKKAIDFLLEKGARFEESDILDFENLKKSSEGYDLVIHLAAKGNVEESFLKPDKIMEVNVTGTENVLRCCIENKIKKLIFASSASVYADSKIPVNENSDTIPLSPYGKSKLFAEQKIKEISNKFDIDAISLRMFNVYGKGQNNQFSGVITKFIRNFSENKPIEIYGDGKQKRDFISIFDIVKAFDCSIKKIEGKRGDVYNIATGNSITIIELVETIQNIFGKKININFIKPKLAEIKISLANVSLAKIELGFVSRHKLSEELKQLV